MTSEAEVNKATKTAEKILNAVVKKFPRYVGYVRRYDCGDSGLIELMIKPENGSTKDEITTAYSDEFFLSATQENINDKARRILSDFKILVGAK